MSSSKKSLNRKQIEVQFDRAAATYDSVAGLQRRMGNRLLERICDSGVDRSEPLLDLGCGTGDLLLNLSQSGFAMLCGIDLSAAMLDVAKEKVPTAKLIHCDIEQIPCKDASIQTIVSNAALQWCNLELALKEIHRVLKRGGYAFVNVFVSGTLSQWQHAFRMIDAESRIHVLASLQEIQSTIDSLGFANCQVEQKKEVETFDSVEAMFSSIRKLGATNATASRRNPIARSTYRSLKDHFQDQLMKAGVLELDFLWAEAVIKK